MDPPLTPKSTIHHPMSFPGQQQNNNGGDNNGFDKFQEDGLEYICGNCGFRNKINPNDKIRCVA
jgi:hypothetical protein